MTEASRRWESSLLKRIKNRKNRSIVLIGNDLFTNCIYENLLLLEIPVITKYSVQKVLDDSALSNYNKEDIFILMAQYRGHKEIYEFLTDKNYQYQLDFSLMGLGGYIENVDCVDSLLTYNRSDDLPGIKIFGDQSTDSYKIVTLGNSTSDPYTGGIKSWSEMLYEMLRKKEYHITLYCAAMTGYTSTQEYLKFNRDILQMKPDLVIMMNGYNDINGNAAIDHFPYLHKYQKRFYDFLLTNPVLAPDSMDMRNMKKVMHGLENDSEDVDIWLCNIRKMKAICNEFNIQFYPYLQPMVEYGGYIIEDDLIEMFKEYFGEVRYETYKRNVQNFCNDARKKIKNFPYIHDLTTIFKGKTGIFYDTCHCNELGNRIISNYIYHDITSVINIKKGIE